METKQISIEQADTEYVQWYYTRDGKVDGPHSLRDLDVKFRTSELASNVLLWRDGMDEWQAGFKIPEIRKLI